MQSLNSPQKSPLPIGGLPVNCCGPAGSPGPLGSIATLSAFNHHKVNQFDTHCFAIYTEVMHYVFPIIKSYTTTHLALLEKIYRNI